MQARVALSSARAALERALQERRKCERALQLHRERGWEPPPLLDAQWQLLCLESGREHAREEARLEQVIALCMDREAALGDAHRKASALLQRREFLVDLGDRMLKRTARPRTFTAG